MRIGWLSGSDANCQTAYFCNGGVAYMRSCSGIQRWNPQTLTCDSADRVTCDGATPPAFNQLRAPTPAPPSLVVSNIQDQSQWNNNYPNQYPNSPAVQQYANPPDGSGQYDLQTAPPPVQFPSPPDSNTLVFQPYTTAPVVQQYVQSPSPPPPVTASPPIPQYVVRPPSQPATQGPVLVPYTTSPAPQYDNRQYTTPAPQYNRQPPPPPYISPPYLSPPSSSQNYSVWNPNRPQYYVNVPPNTNYVPVTQRPPAPSPPPPADRYTQNPGRGVVSHFLKWKHVTWFLKFPCCRCVITIVRGRSGTTRLSRPAVSPSFTAHQKV